MGRNDPLPWSLRVGYLGNTDITLRISNMLVEDIWHAIGAVARDIEAIQSHLKILNGHLAAVPETLKELKRMSGSISDQIDASTAAISSDLDALTAAVTSVSAEIAALQAGMPAGSTVTQAQADALKAADDRLKAQVAALTALEPAQPATPDQPPAPDQPTP